MATAPRKNSKKTRPATAPVANPAPASPFAQQPAPPVEYVSPFGRPVDLLADIAARRNPETNTAYTHADDPHLSKLTDHGWLQLNPNGPNDERRVEAFVTPEGMDIVDTLTNAQTNDAALGAAANASLVGTSTTAKREKPLVVIERAGSFELPPEPVRKRPSIAESVYSFDSLEIGDSFRVMGRDRKGFMSTLGAAHRRLSPMHFKVYDIPGGIRVVRVADQPYTPRPRRAKTPSDASAS